MKSIFAIAAISLSLSFAQAAKPAAKPVDACQIGAATAAKRVLNALGWSKSIEKVGLELTETTVNGDGFPIKTYTTGMFTPVATEGYMKDTGITVEMIEADAGCQVNHLTFSTGAEFQAALMRELQKMQK